MNDETHEKIFINFPDKLMDIFLEFYAGLGSV